jgi:hypothetical protein
MGGRVMSTALLAATAVHRDLARLTSLVARERDHVRALCEPDTSAETGAAASRIATWLYQAWYCAPPEPVTLESRRGGHPDLASVMRAAVASSRRWIPGWVVLEAGRDGSCVAGRRGATRTVRRGEYASVSRPGVPVAPGDALVVAECVSWVDWPTGFWATQSIQAPSAPHVRVYFSVDVAAIAHVLTIVTDCLDALGLRFSLKCPVWPSGFGRVDTLVLYLEQAAWQEAQDAFVAAVRAVEPHTRPWWPPLTLRLAPGVAFAEDPGNDESFGQCRCRILANAVGTLADRLDLTGEATVDVLLQTLAAAGVDPERPWLNGKG